MKKKKKEKKSTFSLKINEIIFESYRNKIFLKYDEES